MTITLDLKALSEAATQGEWLVSACHFDNYAYTISAPASAGHSHVIADVCQREPAKDSAAFICALVNLYRTGHLVLVDDGAVERVAVPKRLTPEMEEAGIAASEDHFVMDNITVTGLHKFYEAAIAALQVKP